MTVLESPIARSADQRLAALRRANQIRIDRARIKRQLFAGELELLDLLIAPPAALHSMKVYDLLKAQRGRGAVKAAKLMRICGIADRKTVGGMTARQRGELCRELGAAE